MYDTGIVELCKIAENRWKAKYQGNYGVYTIKITTNGKKTVKYSCSCPSDYSPCKHISMIEEAISKKIAVEEKSGGLKLEDFIGHVSAERLREFIIEQAKYNTELNNAVMIEFSTNAGNAKGNKFSRLIQVTLASVPHDENDYYLEECLNIDALDQWIDKARNCVRLKKYDEAVLICKAIIEEYSQWLYNVFGWSRSMGLLSISAICCWIYSSRRLKWKSFRVYRYPNSIRGKAKTGGS